MAMADDELEARVTALEAKFGELAEDVKVTKRDAAAARVLAGAADRDVTEIRGELRDFRNATTASFNLGRPGTYVLVSLQQLAEDPDCTQANPFRGRISEISFQPAP